ncbi:metallophosphoesterase family protein [Paracoccus mutanolyticus]|uniref:hypothetical protein n=1 Tax=Paracoccus mutanolyticus TaxID=1499308 RepID=UPI001CB8B07C|nr:hypothetical protein [Paracoccus mutanolyticus]
MIPQHFPVENPATGAAIRLKILATTDLHMHILGFDYYADRTAEQFGLSRVAALISAERMGSPNVLLFDNGDSLQGGPRATIWPRRPSWDRASAIPPSSR